MSPLLSVRTRRPGFSGATAADRYGSSVAGVAVKLRPDGRSAL